jgi:tetratricopeptide (TPR) repeat protein
LHRAAVFGALFWEPALRALASGDHLPLIAAARYLQGLETAPQTTDDLTRIAEHLELGGNLAQAVAYFHRAAEVAFHLKAPATLRMLERALALMPTDYGAAELYLTAGNCYGSASKIDKALELYADSLKLFQAQGNKLGRARAVSGIGMNTRQKGNYRRAEKLLRDSRRLSQKPGDLSLKAEALAGLGGVFRGLGDYAAER